MSECKKLSELFLAINNIQDLEETLGELSQMPLLRILDLYENPCTKIYSYKYDIIWNL